MSDTLLDGVVKYILNYSPLTVKIRTILETLQLVKKFTITYLFYKYKDFF